jgi:ParB-like chromosome segregation protein Spo0J
MEVARLPLVKLRRRQGARKLVEAKMPGLVDSIREIGIINPLRVRPIEIYEGGRPAEGWEVTAGAHRFEAASRLGMVEVPCVIVADDDLHAELAMIDENLCRAELSPAEAAYQSDRRKEIYEQLHPETRRGAAGGHGKHGSASDNLSFAEDAAAKTGRDKRTIYRDAARGAALGEVLKDIVGTSLDKGVEIDALAKLAPEQRADVIDKVKRGEVVSARQYELAGPSGVDRDLKLEAARNMASWLAEHSDASQWEWIKSTLYTAGAKAVADAFVNETGAGQSVMDRRFG